MPARGWRRGVSEGVEPSEWTLHDKIDEKRPFWALKNEDEPPGPGRPEGGAPLPGGPSGGRPGDVRTPREREVRRALPHQGRPAAAGGRPAAGGLERRCSYRSSPGGRRSCSSMAVQASTSPGGTPVVRGAVHPDGPPGSTGAGLPSALAPPERHAHVPGEEDADGEPGAERLEADARRRAARGSDPRGAAAPEGPIRRRRTGRRRTGPELRPTRGRSRTPSGGDVPGRHLSVLGCSPPGRRTGMLPGDGERQLDVGVPKRVPRGAGRRRTGTPAPSRCSPGAPASISYSGTPLVPASRGTWSAPGPGERPGGAPPRDEYRPGSARDVVCPLLAGRSSGPVRRGCPGGGRWGRASTGTVPPSGHIAPPGRSPGPGADQGPRDVVVPERVRRGRRDVYPSPACTGASSGTSAVWAGGAPLAPPVVPGRRMAWRAPRSPVPNGS